LRTILFIHLAPDDIANDAAGQRADHESRTSADGVAERTACSPAYDGAGPLLSGATRAEDNGQNQHDNNYETHASRSCITSASRPPNCL
jgi:hypothetical protein